MNLCASLSLPPTLQWMIYLLQLQNVHYSRKVKMLHITEQRACMNLEKPYPIPAMLVSGWLAIATFCSVTELESGTLIILIVKVSQLNHLNLILEQYLVKYTLYETSLWMNLIQMSYCMFLFTEIKCEKFSIPNGKVKFGHLTFNTKVNISCKDGYHLKGSSVVTCGADNSWTPALPTCEQSSTQGRSLPLHSV